MAEPPSCSLCRRRRESLVAATPEFYCPACLAALGRLFREGSVATVNSIWTANRTSPSDSSPGRRAPEKLLSEDREKRGEPASPREPSGPKSFADLSESLADDLAETGIGDFETTVEDVFAEFKAGLAKVVSPFDVETHLDLAIAYREMGLVDDALGEAAIALEHGASQLRERALEAVSILLNPIRLRQSLAETLARLRLALFPE